MTLSNILSVCALSMSLALLPMVPGAVFVLMHLQVLG